MPDSKDGSAHLDGLAQDAPDAPREHSEPSATPYLAQLQRIEDKLDALLAFDQIHDYAAFNRDHGSTLPD